eukprot:54304-Eustigmatos_ZCMA.PRE.2
MMMNEALPLAQRFPDAELIIIAIMGLGTQYQRVLSPAPGTAPYATYQALMTRALTQSKISHCFPPNVNDIQRLHPTLAIQQGPLHVAAMVQANVETQNSKYLPPQILTGFGITPEPLPVKRSDSGAAAHEGAGAAHKPVDHRSECEYSSDLTSLATAVVNAVRAGSAHQESTRKPAQVHRAQMGRTRYSPAGDDADGKRNCFICGGQGHWKRECRYRGSAKCDTCGKGGHLARACYGFCPDCGFINVPGHDCSASDIDYDTE